MTDMREAVARAINPYAFKSWQGMYDHCLPDEGEENARRYADMTHKADCDKALQQAAEIEALMQPEIDRRVAEERAKLLERLREPTHEMVSRLNAACDTPDVQMAWVFPYIADMLAQFEKENSDEQG